MDMNEKKVVYFNLLGSFSYALPEEDSQPGDVRTLPKKTGKKALSFLQYLLVNHSRNISSEELMDTFWTEDESSDPANALRNMLHKIRGLLKEILPGQQGEILMTLQGCYAWNPKIRITSDCEEFEKICLEAREHSGEKNLELLRRACSLYKGSFLAGNDSEWVKVPRQYYRTLYLDICKALLPLLEEKEEWMDIVSVCNRAYQVEFCMEEFTVCQMRAFIAMGQPRQAIEKYETFKERMLKELGLPPTKRVEQIHTLAQGFCREEKGNEDEIFRLVCEADSLQHAFFCSFGVFQNIVALERRHLARSGQISTLVIVSLDGGKVIGTDARRLERILTEGLRTGDPVARLAAGSYIVMLTGADAGNAQIVTSRLDCAFHKTYRHSNARLSFRISALCPEKEK